MKALKVTPNKTTSPITICEIATLWSIVNNDQLVNDDHLAGGVRWIDVQSQSRSLLKDYVKQNHSGYDLRGYTGVVISFLQQEVLDLDNRMSNAERIRDVRLYFRYLVYLCEGSVDRFTLILSVYRNILKELHCIYDTVFSEIDSITNYINNTKEFKQHEVSLIYENWRI